MKQYKIILPFEEVVNCSIHPNILAIKKVNEFLGFDESRTAEGEFFLTQDLISMDYIIYYTPTEKELLLRKFDVEDKGSGLD